MAEHRIHHNGIIYIIPNDELFQKYKNEEAFIDKFGRLIDSTSKRVIKELEQIGSQRPVIQKQVVMVQPPKEHPIRDAAEQAGAEITRYFLFRMTDWVLDEGIPLLWHKYFVPLYHRAKEALTTTKENGVQQQTEMSLVAKDKPKANITMTQAEADAEKRKVLYHWLGMMSSLKKLQDAGEIDADVVLSQLTKPAMLKRVNSFLSENPNLLETDKYIQLHGFLGREPYNEDGELVPIEAVEIRAIAALYGYAQGLKKMEGF